MTIYLPSWLLIIPAVYLGVGILLYPVLMVRVHRAMSHNVGWTWRTTLAGQGFHPFRVAFGTLAVIVAWPWAMREV